MSFEKIGLSKNVYSGLIHPLNRMLYKLFGMSYTNGSFGGQAFPSDPDPNPSGAMFWIAGPGYYPRYGDINIPSGSIGYIIYKGGNYSLLTASFSLQEINHSELSGLLDDDHPQYLNNTRGDLRYYLKSEINNLLASFTSDHGGLDGLEDDDHPQYHNNSRGDARYLKRDGSNDIQGNMNMNDYRIISLQSPSGNYDAVNKIWAEQQFAKKVNVLSKSNTTPYEPTEDYHPATLKRLLEEVNAVQLSNLFVGYFANSVELNDSTYTYSDVNIFSFGVPVLRGLHNDTTLYMPGALVQYNSQYYVLTKNSYTFGAWSQNEWTNIISNETIYFNGRIFIFDGTEIVEKPYIKKGSFAIVEQTDTVWIYDSDNQTWTDSNQNSQVISVNGKTGNVSLTANDIPETTSRKFISPGYLSDLIDLFNALVHDNGNLEVQNDLKILGSLKDSEGNVYPLVSQLPSGNGQLTNSEYNAVENSDNPDDDNPFQTLTALRKNKIRVNESATATFNLNNYDFFKHTPGSNQQYTIQNFLVGDLFAVRLLAGSGSLHSSLFIMAGKTVNIKDDFDSITGYDNSKVMVLSCHIISDEGNVVTIDTVLS